MCGVCLCDDNHTYLEALACQYLYKWIENLYDMDNGTLFTTSCLCFFDGFFILFFFLVSTNLNNFLCIMANKLNDGFSQRSPIVFKSEDEV